MTFGIHFSFSSLVLISCLQVVGAAERAIVLRIMPRLAPAESPRAAGESERTDRPASILRPHELGVELTRAVEIVHAEPQLREHLKKLRVPVDQDGMVSRGALYWRLVDSGIAPHHFELRGSPLCLPEPTPRAREAGVSGSLRK